MQPVAYDEGIRQEQLHFATESPDRQRGSAGDDCVLSAGLCWTMGAAGWTRAAGTDGGVNDIFCLMSSPIACSVAMF